MGQGMHIVEDVQETIPMTQPKPYNLPIIKFSVDWWNTLHQPDTITLTGAPTMYIGMLWPLLLAALGYSLAFAAIVLARTRAAVMERRIRALLMARADELSS